MTIDELYLENIDEYVKDESKIVTYKWLSLTLQVHCNTAKQMLYKYIDTERNVKGGGDGLTVTYFVSGLTKPDGNGEQVFKCMVVPEEKLESSKTTLSVLTSCHVYSVQKTQLKDSNALYMTDYAKFKENVFDCNRYSSIECERAELRSQDDLDLISVEYKTLTETEKPSAANGSTASKQGSKKQQPTAIASMFANKKTNIETKKDVKPAVKEEVKAESKAVDKGSSKKNEGLKALFSKQADKKAEAPKEMGKKASKEEVRKSPERKSSPAKSESKKKARQEDSDEEEPMTRSKRRRTGPDLFDSDSGEEEEMEEEPESPIPPTTQMKVNPKPVIKHKSPEMEEIEDPVPNNTSKEEPAKGNNSAERRRVRKRKLVDKTYMDDQGFMVTEKVYEEVSTDAFEAEERMKEVKQAPAKSPPKGKKSPKKPSPGKKGGPSGKQTSLMSFFKKS